MAQYLIVDNDTNIICANVTDLVNRYPNAKEKAHEMVEEMNANLIKAGDVASFRVEEAPSNVSFILPGTRTDVNLEADTLEEAALTVEFLNHGLGEPKYKLHAKTYNPKVVYLCNRKY